MLVCQSVNAELETGVRRVRGLVFGENSGTGLQVVMVIRVVRKRSDRFRIDDMFVVVVVTVAVEVVEVEPYGNVVVIDRRFISNVRRGPVRGGDVSVTCSIDNRVVAGSLGYPVRCTSL